MRPAPVSFATGGYVYHALNRAVGRSTIFEKVELRDLAAPFGLNHPDSVSNLIRRAEKHLAQSRQDRNLAARIVETITKTENRV
jgi:hypothetical protein